MKIIIPTNPNNFLDLIPFKIQIFKLEQLKICSISAGDINDDTVVCSVLMELLTDISLVKNKKIIKLYHYITVYWEIFNSTHKQ